MQQDSGEASGWILFPSYGICVCEDISIKAGHHTDLSELYRACGLIQSEMRQVKDNLVLVLQQKAATADLHRRAGDP